MKKMLVTLLLALVMVLGMTLGIVPNAEAAQAAEADIELLYDDRKELTSLVDEEGAVSISNEVVTSYKVGTSTKDDHVLVYQDGVLYAVGTGTATLTVGDTSYSVRVSPAPISLFMITGHSIGAGQEGNGSQSVVVEAGQAYSSYHQNSLDVTEVDGYGLGWGSENRVGGVEGLVRPNYDSYGHIDAFAPGMGGTTGTGSGFAYRWNQVTGEKVWVINIAVGGSCINEWMPGAKGHNTAYDLNYYDQTISKFTYAQTILKNEVAAGHYTMSKQGIINFAGANFAYYPNWSMESIQQDYIELWDAYQEELFTVDINSDGTPDGPEVMAFVPYVSDQSFASDRPAVWYMGTNADYAQHVSISQFAVNWLTVAGIQSTFPAIDYTTQDVAVTIPDSVYHIDQGGTSENSVFCKADKVHYSQVSSNAIGLDMGKNLAAWFFTDEKHTQAESVALKDRSRKDIASVVNITVGQSYMMTPVVEPVTVSDLTYEVTGAAELTYPLAVKGTAVGTATLTIKQGDRVLKTMTFNVRAAHAHCECGGKHSDSEFHTCSEAVTYVPLTLDSFTNYRYNAYNSTTGKFSNTGVSNVLRSGNYYLNGDYTLASSIYIAPGATVKLCLNGYKLTVKDRAFKPNGDLAICDCSAHGIGSVYSTSTANAPILYTYSGANVRIYGGTFSAAASTSRTSGGLCTIINDMGIYDVDIDGDGAHTAADKLPVEVSIYGGTITGGQAKNGGNVHLNAAAAVFNMYGGTITDGVATSQGGNVCVNNGIFNMYDGTITGGKAENSTAKTYGGGICCTTATLKLLGGKITANESEWGPDVYGTSSAKVTLGGDIQIDNYYSNSIVLALENLSPDARIGLGRNNANDPDKFATGATTNVSGCFTNLSHTREVLWDSVAQTLSFVKEGGTTPSTPPAQDTEHEDHCVCADSTGKPENHECDPIEDFIELTQADFTNVTADGKYVYTFVDGSTTYYRLRSGNYYLGSNLTPGRTIRVLKDDGSADDVTICLNGYNITSTTRVFAAVKGGKLTITDCQHSKASDGTNTYKGTVSAPKVTSYASVMYIDSSASVNLYGGNFTGTKVTTTGTNYPGGTIYVGGTTAGTTLNIYDGKISGGDTSYDSVTVEVNKKPTNAGNMYVTGGSTVVNMYGGSIEGGKAGTQSGGNVFIADGTFNMNGGMISGGDAANGGNVALSNAKAVFTMNGGTITGGNATTNGGNIMVIEGTFMMIDGTISNGSATNAGGNVRLSDSTNKTTAFNMTGGTISKGTAREGGSISIGSKGTFNMEGGTVTGGSTSKNDGNGGGNFLAYGKLNISGGRVENGTAKTCGGNISCHNNSTNIVISGGVITGGNAPKGANILMSTSATTTVYLTITGGKIEGVAAGATSRSVHITDNTKIVTKLGGSAVVDDIYFEGSNAVFTIDSENPLAAGAVIGLSVTASGQIVCNEPGANYADYFTANDGYMLALDDNGKLLLTKPCAAVYKGSELIGQFVSFEDAANAAMNGAGYVKLLDNTEASYELTGTLYLDLNGHVLTGDISGNGTLYGMDSTTDSYTTDNMGRITGTVSCNVAGNFKTNVTGAVRRYMAIKDDAGYTFHRFYLGITHATLKPGTKGVGYKAVFAGDDMVKACISSFGYTLQLDNNTPVTVSKEGSELVSKDTWTLRVDNYDTENMGLTELSASVFMVINGETISASTYTTTLKDLVEAINADATILADAGKKAALEAWIATSEAMKSWNVSNIYTA